MGGLVKPAPEAEGGPEEQTEAGPSKPNRQPTFSGWAGFGKAGAGDPKKKGGAATKDIDEEDDRKIRFTIGGVGRRMTKDDFLMEIQKLDPKTRREVVEDSSAPAAVKSEAKQPQIGTASPKPSSRDAPAQPASTKEQVTSSASSSGKSPVPSETRGRSTTITGAGRQEASSNSDAPETDAERRRRIAAFASVREDTDDRETPAERRRREAALGVSGEGAEDSDSDDDNTERVPSSSRRPGIRFADDAAARRRA